MLGRVKSFVIGGSHGRLPSELIHIGFRVALRDLEFRLPDAVPARSSVCRDTEVDVTRCVLRMIAVVSSEQGINIGCGDATLNNTIAQPCLIKTKQFLILF